VRQFEPDEKKPRKQFKVPEVPNHDLSIGSANSYRSIAFAADRVASVLFIFAACVRRSSGVKVTAKLDVLNFVLILMMFCSPACRLAFASSVLETYVRTNRETTAACRSCRR
jgi:hypothetical protein